MKRTTPKLLTLHRWKLNEAQLKLSDLIRLREGLESQLLSVTRATSAVAGLEQDQVKQRSAHLTMSIEQVDSQIAAARVVIEESRRVLRLLETGGPRRQGATMSRAG
jgi:hypothetical protein